MSKTLIHDRMAQRERFGTPNGAGWSCIDFTNTVNGRTQDEPRDKVADYGSLLAWAEHMELLSPEEIDELSAVSLDEPGEATAVVQRARQLREAIFQLLTETTAPGSGHSLEILNAELSEAQAHRKLALHEETLQWRWDLSKAPLSAPLWPIAHSAARLLTSDWMVRVGCCASDDCGWLFFDTSRNRSRRWCDMASCGNRAKAHRFYHRQQND